MIRRFVEGVFDDKYLSTIGTKISRKSLDVAGQNLTMLIWDLAGGEKFSRMMQSYYRGAAGAILVCDLTRKETLDALDQYVGDFWKVNPHTPLVIAGNKVDLVTARVISDANLAAFAEQYQASWFVSSAKSGQHVESLFQTLGNMIYVKVQHTTGEQRNGRAT